jgi:hypothetical protein
MAPMKWIGATLALFCLLLSSSARAEEFTRKRFVLSDGSFEITGDPARPAMVGLNASRGAFGDPLTIAPHFYWGVTNDLAIGISHERGLCLGDNCGDKVYNDAGFDLMFHLIGAHKFELELHAGVPVSSFDPFVVGVQAGVIGRVNFGSVVALVFDPAVYIRLNKRRPGNRDALLLPFWFYFQATDVVVPFVGSSVSGPFDGFFDDFAPPLEGGILFDVARNVDVGFMMRFDRLLGSDGDADQRSLHFLGRFRF